ncbi:hypothetical protein [Acinetobacter ursingii]|uniref:hypothetical protein n=1 Tax=Acinetobacter ursingii TaxID=108980 RepID=UPI003AF9719B
MSDHNTFGKLVQDDKDFVGMVAYTIYKKDKNNWIDTYEAKHGVKPTYDQIQQFFNIDTTTDQKISGYRRLAADRLNTFIDETTLDELVQYKNLIRDEEIVKAVHTPMWKSIRDNVSAGIVGAALVSGFSIFYWLGQVKEDTEFQKKFNEKVSEELGLTQKPEPPK